MRILFLGNNWLGWKVLQWLNEQGESVLAAALHPGPKRKYGDEILKAVDDNNTLKIDGSALKEEAVLKFVASLKTDVAVSVLFDYILEPDFIDLFPNGVINVHPSFLPFNRGQYPNVWSIVERTPAGVTIHFIDKRIDTGDIIAQREVPVLPIDTGESLYRKLELEGLELFKQTWPKIANNQFTRIPQNEQGTYHSRDGVKQIDKIDLDATYKARDLIDIIRARTFPPYKGAYFLHEGRKIYMEMNLKQEETDDPV